MPESIEKNRDVINWNIEIDMSLNEVHSIWEIYFSIILWAKLSGSFLKRLSAAIILPEDI